MGDVVDDLGQFAGVRLAFRLRDHFRPGRLDVDLQRLQQRLDIGIELLGPARLLIIVAALWSRAGASFEIVERALSGRLDFAVSVALALEYEAVLRRARMREASWETEAELDVILDGLLARANRIMPIRTRLRPVLPDPADDMVLECAVQSGADSIVTRNVRDFRAAYRLYRVEAIMPGELLNRLKEGGE